MTSEHRPTIVYYRSDRLLITNRYLVGGARRYEMAELGDLQLARGNTHPGAVVGLVIAVAEGAFVAPFAGLIHSPAAWLTVAVALAVPCLVGLYCARRWPAQLELIADYRGRQVLLFATRDAVEFGKVTRSAQRAARAQYR
jgi:Family of unknown function (DUF6232)